MKKRIKTKETSTIRDLPTKIKYTSEETKQRVSDILHNIEIIKKKVKLKKFSEEHLKKLDMELFLWT